MSWKYHMWCEFTRNLSTFIRNPTQRAVCQTATTKALVRLYHTSVFIRSKQSRHCEYRYPIENKIHTVIVSYVHVFSVAHAQIPDVDEDFYFNSTYDDRSHERISFKTQYQRPGEHCALHWTPETYSFNWILRTFKINVCRFYRFSKYFTPHTPSNIFCAEKCPSIINFRNVRPISVRYVRQKIKLSRERFANFWPIDKQLMSVHFSKYLPHPWKQMSMWPWLRILIILFQEISMQKLCYASELNVRQYCRIRNTETTLTHNTLQDLYGWAELQDARESKPNSWCFKWIVAFCRGQWKKW